MLSKKAIKLRGRLRIWEHGSGRKIFDMDNTLCNEGMESIMNWLSGTGGDYIDSIILLSDTTAPAVDDTFISKVRDNILPECVLHGGDNFTSGSSGLVLSVTGNLVKEAGNDTTGTPPNNELHSASLVMGSSESGGLGEVVYSVTGGEKLLSRIDLGIIVKTSRKSYDFSWDITMEVVT